VSMTPLINIHSRLSWRIFKEVNDPNGILRGPGDTESWKITEVESRVRLPLSVIWCIRFLALTFVTSTLCAVNFSKSYVKCRLRYVMLRFVAIPFFLDRRIRTWAKTLF
jgi:hypothetical protein